MEIRRIKIFICILVLFLIPSFSHIYGATLSNPANNLGLVGYWSFNEGTSTKATDFSGRGNAGNLTNMATPATASSGWGNGKFGGGLNFDGTDDYVEVPSNSAFGITGDITISAWIKRNVNNDYGGILSKGNGSSRWDYEFYMCGDAQCGGTNNIGLYTDAPGGNIISTGQITDLLWHHVVVTRSGTTVTFYIDGVSSGGGTYSGSFNNNSDPIRIGTDGPGWSPLSIFNGSIDEVRLYNRSLSAPDIRKLYATGVAKINASQNNLIKNGLVGMWSFNSVDMTSTLVYDRSGSNNNGTLVGTKKTMGKIGQALLFNGTSEYVDVSDNASLNSVTSFTVMGWIKRTASNWSPIYDAGSGANDWAFQISNNQKITYTEKSINDYMGTSNVQNGVWQHVAAVKNGDGASNITFYLNGVADGTASAGAVATPSGGKVIGYDGSLFFPGALDDVRVYNRALSAIEIKTLYNVGESKLNASQNNLGQSSLNSGLVGMWSFNSKDLSDKVYDRSGQGNDGYHLGRATSTAKTIGKVGQAFDFDGATDSVYLGIPASLFPTSAITMSAWIKPDTAGNSQIIIANDDALTVSNQMRTQGAGGTRCSISNTSSTQGSSLVALEWNHIACVYDGANIINYINGVNVGSTPLTGSITYANSNTEPWRIGRRGDAAPGYFDGKIDEARIYNRALTSSEIKQLYLFGR